MQSTPQAEPRPVPQTSPARIQKTCDQCGKPYVPYRKTQRYCLECRSEEPERARQRTREWNRKQIQHLTPTELEECLQDPRKVWTIRAPNHIACILAGCGELHEQLGHHLRVRHGLTAAAYKALPGPDGKTPRFSKTASLLCLSLRERLSKKRRNLRLGRRLQNSGKVPPIKKLIASRGRRVLKSQQYRLEQGERARRPSPSLLGTYRGKRLARPTEDWEIARQWDSDNNYDEIARVVSLHRGTVATRLRRIGFSCARAVYWHGRPLLGRDVRAMCADLEITIAKISDVMGLSYMSVKQQTGPKWADRWLPRKLARRFKESYEKLREQYRHRPQRPDGGRPHLLLPNERKAIPLEYGTLLPDIKAILKWAELQGAEERAVSLPDVRAWVYLESRKGRLRALALWPYFFEWLQNWGSVHRLLRGYGLRASYTAMEFLADVYKVTPDSIRTARLSTAAS